MCLFGKSQEKNQKEMVQEWVHKLRKESYSIDRQVRAIMAEEDKVKRALKDAAQKGDRDVCKMLAKEVVRASKACRKLHTSKAYLNSVSLQLKNQLAMIRVAGSVSRSTEIMQAMQALVRVPEVADTMRELSKEMMKAGIIDEMVDETMETIEDSEDMEEEADEDADKVLWETTAGLMGRAPALVTDTIGASTSKEEEKADNDIDEKELEEMKNRLQTLRS